MNPAKVTDEDYIQFLIATTLWEEAAVQVSRQGGVLVVDDSTLDKPYAKKMALVHRHGSGKHH
ncbi:MAG: IS701 family transposase, partial [Candidatus Contendobacter sp.]